MKSKLTLHVFYLPVDTPRRATGTRALRRRHSGRVIFCLPSFWPSRGPCVVLQAPAADLIWDVAPPVCPSGPAGTHFASADKPLPHIGPSSIIFPPILSTRRKSRVVEATTKTNWTIWPSKAKSRSRIFSPCTVTETPTNAPPLISPGRLRSPQSASHQITMEMEIPTPLPKVKRFCPIKI